MRHLFGLCGAGLLLIGMALLFPVTSAAAVAPAPLTVAAETAIWVRLRPREAVLSDESRWAEPVGKTNDRPAAAAMTTAAEKEEEGPTAIDGAEAAPSPSTAHSVHPVSDFSGVPFGSAGYRIELPTLGVAYPVYADIGNAELASGPGWYPYTARPGEGNTGIAAHRTYGGAPSFFYALDKLAPSDPIVITYPDRRLIYTVERVWITHPYDLAVLDPTEVPALTLTTCDPPGTEDNRLIVRAVLMATEP